MSDILTAENLGEGVVARHAFFTKNFGNPGLSQGETRVTAFEARAKMAACLRVSAENFVVCHQIHSADVVIVEKPWDAGENPKADALVTSQKGVALGVLTADCVPVLFLDEKAGVIGAAHAGWRGALSGILENTLTAMESLGARRKKIAAALGPCIWQNSYEVGPEFPAPFLAENPEYSRFFRAAFKSDRYMFDLPGYVVGKLKAAGLGDVDASPADTCADPDRFYSHRFTTLNGHVREGNLMSAISLAD